jgi:hypothetical protein
MGVMGGKITINLKTAKNRRRINTCTPEKS